MFKKILLKLSGEALSGTKENGIDEETLETVCQNIKTVYDKKVKIAIVVGGGNFYRGRYGKNLNKTSGDYMGMLATAMNALALKDRLCAIGVKAIIQSSIEIKGVIDAYSQNTTMEALNNDTVVIFACGTGLPYFSTDTGAAIRACQIEADAILVAKTVDGVYSADPKVDKNAIKYDKITYQEILEKGLKVMDSPSIALCMDNNIPLVVFEMKSGENIIKAVNEENIGTIIKN